MPDSIEETNPRPGGLRLGRLRRARKERRRRLAEELVSQQGPVPAEGDGEPQEARLGPQGPAAHLAVVAAEERVKVAEQRLEERMRQSSAEMEDLVRTEAHVRARAEAAERELAAAQQRLRELTRKLSDRDREHERNARAELERKLASLKAAFEDCLAEAASPSGPEASPSKQVEAVLDQRSEANGEPGTADLTGAVDVKAEEFPSEVEAKWRLVRAADRLREIQGRLREMENRARSAEERAERAEQIARVKAEEAGPLRSNNDSQLRGSPSPARVHSERGTPRST